VATGSLPRRPAPARCPEIPTKAKEAALSRADQDDLAKPAIGRSGGDTTYDRIAFLYDVLDAPYEYGWRRRLRRKVFAGLSGRILDAGAGTGANLPFYPPGAEMHAIDVSRKMLDRASARAGRAGRAVSIGVHDLCRTPFPDGHFDAVVSTFVFCVLDDAQQLPALAELARICRKDGEIRLIDYRMSQHPVGAAAMKALSRWSGWVFDCRYQPTTDQYIAAAGLDIVESRFVVGDIVKLLVLRPRA